MGTLGSSPDGSFRSSPSSSPNSSPSPSSAAPRAQPWLSFHPPELPAPVLPLPPRVMSPVPAPGDARAAPDDARAALWDLCGHRRGWQVPGPSPGIRAHPGQGDAAAPGGSSCWKVRTGWMQGGKKEPGSAPSGLPLPTATPHPLCKLVSHLRTLS